MSKLWKPTRRLFLASGASLIAAPAIVRAGTLPLLGAGSQPVTAATSATWNPADVGGSFVLSNGNLTATPTQPPSSALGGRSTVSKSSGKYYWEILIVTFAADWQHGIVTGGWDENSQLINTANGCVIRDDGLMGYNSSNGLSGFSFASSDVINFALDLDNSKMWFRKNGAGNWNGSGTDNPATNTGGRNIAGFSTPAFASAWFVTANNDVITARFSSASWTGTAPAGFGQLA